MRRNQKTVTSKNYGSHRLLEALEALYKIYPHIKFNTFDVVQYANPTKKKTRGT